MAEGEEDGGGAAGSPVHCQIFIKTDQVAAEAKAEELHQQPIFIVKTDAGRQLGGTPAVVESSSEIMIFTEEQVVEEVVDSKSQQQVFSTEEGQLLQVYEEIILPDGMTSESCLAPSLGSPEVGSLTGVCAEDGKKERLTPSPQVEYRGVNLDCYAEESTVTGNVKFHVCRVCNMLVPAGVLEDHYAIDHGLTCSECGKLFKSKRSLIGHKKEKHSGMLEAHTCPECGKSFGRKSNLKAHRESLHYGKKFPCDHCDRIFTNRSSMNQHVKKVHGGGVRHTINVPTVDLGGVTLPEGTKLYTL